MPISNKSQWWQYVEIRFWSEPESDSARPKYIHSTIRRVQQMATLDYGSDYYLCNDRFGTIDCEVGVVIFRETPELPDTIPNTQKSMAKLAHGTLYLVMFVVFVSGFLMLKHEYPFFWLFTIPNSISNAEVNAFFFMVHRFGCATLASLVLLHALAALKHHFVNKNDVLKSMAFNLSKLSRS